MHSEGHAVAHLIGVLPIPGDFARPGIQVISPHASHMGIVRSPALAVLILKEADYTCGKLKEELNCEEECKPQTLWCHLCERENTYHLPVTHHSFSHGTGQPSVREKSKDPLYRVTTSVGEDRNSSILRVKNEGPWAKSHPLPVFANKILLKHSPTHSFTIV